MPCILLLFVFLSHSLRFSPDMRASLHTNFRSVGSSVLVMILLASFNPGSTSLAWLDLYHTGKLYSTAEELTAIAVVRKVCGSAPHLEFANFPRKLLRVAIFAFTFVTYLAYVSVLSKVTPRKP